MGSARGWEVPHVLDWLPNALSDVIVTAQFTERLSAALRTAVITDCYTTVTALGHGTLAARRTYVAVTGYVFDLA